MLTKLAKKYGTDKLSNGYISAYAHHFEPIRDYVKTVLELGVFGGASLKMWRDYFPHAKIIGIDIDPSKKQDLGRRIEIIITSQDNKEELSKIGPVDIVIDDASHINKLTISSFQLLKNSVSFFYVMEDMLNSYECDILPYKKKWPGMDFNTLQSQDWFNRRIDIDKIINEEISATDSNRGFSAIHIYKQIYFFEK
jgi:hypothetical protein